MRFSVLILLVPIMLYSCSANDDISSVRVFCASSAYDLVQAIADLYEKDTGMTVRINSASSGVLARQIELGAEADLFISASRQWTDYLVDMGISEEVGSFFENRLVLIAPGDSPYNSLSPDPISLLPLLLSSRLSMGDPDHVPAGQYGLEVLESLGLTPYVRDRILPAANVRAALSAVELGEAELGIVYKTDALKSGSVKILTLFDDNLHSPVLYFGALTDSCSRSGRIFYQYLKSSREVDELIRSFGFSRAKA